MNTTTKPKHTPEPWEVIGPQFAISPFYRVSIAKVVFDHVEESREYVADFNGVSTENGMIKTKANAARAVACVNAMQGLNPEAVGAVVEALQDAIDSYDVFVDVLPRWFDKAVLALAALKAVRQ